MPPTIIYIWTKYFSSHCGSDLDKMKCKQQHGIFNMQAALPFITPLSSFFLQNVYKETYHYKEAGHNKLAAATTIKPQPGFPQILHTLPFTLVCETID